MKKTSLSILFLFLFMQILNFKVYGDMHDMPMDMPSVDQKAYTKKISVPDTPQKVKDATLSKQEVLKILKMIDIFLPQASIVLIKIFSQLLDLFKEQI